jgi:CubicO group peptidase (beta-lactamase class C family)
MPEPDDVPPLPTLDVRLTRHRWLELLPGFPVGAESAASVAWARVGTQVQTATRGCGPDHLFQAASVSKSIAAAAVLGLVDRGRVRLDDPVNDVLGRWSLRTPGGARSTATVRQLLAHTAGVTVHGFPGYPRGATVPRLSDVLEGRAPAVNEPVRAIPDRAGAFRYSGGGYCVLQRAVTDLTGTTYPAFVRDTVLEPAGMRSATFTPDRDGPTLVAGWEDGRPVPGGAYIYPELAAAGMWCTPTDLVRFGLHLIRSIRCSDRNRPSVFATEMARPHSATYTVGLELLTLPGHGTVLGHAGCNRGFKSMLGIDLEWGTAAAVMVNDDRATLTSRATVLRAALQQAADQPG